MAEGQASSQMVKRRSPLAPAVAIGVLVAVAGGLYLRNKAQTKPPTAPVGAPAAAHYQTGLKLAQSGDLTGAANEWQTAIGLDPSFTPPYLALEKKSEQAGDFPGAIKMLDALRQADPHAQHIVCRQAGLYLKANRYETALATAREAVRQESDCAQAHTMLGAVLAKAGDWTNAAQEFQAAHRVAPEEAAITLTLALALAHSGKANEAISLVEGLPAPERESVPALYRLGWLLAEYGRDGHRDDKAALEALNQALAKDPAHADSNAEVGAILLRAGKVAEARAAFDRALHSDSTNVQAARGMAAVYTRLKLPEAAQAEQVAARMEKQEETLRQTRGHYLTHPDDRDNNLKLAEWEGRNHNMDDAMELIRRVLQKDPNDTAALSLLHRYVRPTNPTPGH